MKLLPLDRLGARGIPSGVEFGVFFPGIVDEYELWVKVIHEKDQFLQNIPPREFEMSHSEDAEYGDYWSAKIEMKGDKDSNWGKEGRYVYRYCLKKPKEVDWIIDPYAREFGIGKLSAFTWGYKHYKWSKNEDKWKTPSLDDLIIYELNINEFGGDIEKAICLLDYLKDLGINCIELMPVSNVSNTVDWGYMPIGYFGVDERFGKRKDFQRFIDGAHKKGIAVIVDAVYGHTSQDFAYFHLYNKLGLENPFIGSFAKDYFGESTNFCLKFTQDFFFTVNHHWLSCYHIDGFRYDCVPNYWDGATGDGYANLVYHTYTLVKENPNDFKRFFDKERINIIQCAEQLEGPVEILRQTYSNCTWQNETLGSAKGASSENKDEITNLGFRLGLSGYPDEITCNDDKIQKSALQYIENHDHSRFICNLGTIFKDNELLKEGDRELWYKIQPYLIGMCTAKGIPMLWQGQEFCENYYVPEGGWGRVLLFRPVRWDYFYDEIGKRIVWLVRKLIKIRKENEEFRYGDHYFYNHYDNYQSKNLLLFSRQYKSNFSLVALNFSNSEQWAPFSFPKKGNYKELLHNERNLKVESDDYWLSIPSNYGCIWRQDGI